MNKRWLMATLTVVLAAGCANTAPSPGASSVPDAAAAAKAAMGAAFAKALQGDGPGAVAVLRPLDPALLPDKARPIRECMLQRLDARTLPVSPLENDKFLNAVLRAYQEYWLRSLRGEHPAAENEAWLLDSLNTLVSSSGGKRAKNMDELEPALAVLIEPHGFHSLEGQTLPLRELMLWKTQTPQRYDVQLPEGPQPVTVTFMDDFASLGWAAFATCDAAHTGGWTKPESLYAVRSAYDTRSEHFRVSYLAHEAQHYSDNARFPNLEQPELEYRAKLTELAVGKTMVYGLLDFFDGNVSADRNVPHSFANGRVVADLRARLFGSGGAPPRWRDASVDRINAAAAELLKGDTQRLSQAPAVSH